MLLALITMAVLGASDQVSLGILEPWRIDSLNKIRAASVFSSAQNHIFVHYGSISGLALLLRDSHSDLGGISGIRYCFSFDQPRLLENFQRQLELSDDSLVKTIVLFGLESILNTKSSSIDIESASLLDILYLISDNSSPYHNVNIFILLKNSIYVVNIDAIRNDLTI